MPQALNQVETKHRIDLRPGETSFAKGEKIRHKLGYDALRQILQLNNPSITKLLGIDKLPENADLTRDWLTPTRITDVSGFATLADGTMAGTKCQFFGTRLAVDVIDRDSKGRKNGKITPTGGGLRIKFVELSPKNDKGEVLFSDLKQVRKGVLDEGLGLAIAMGAKNIGLGFERQLSKVIRKMNLPEAKRKALLKMAKLYSLAGGGKADLYIALEGKEGDYSSDELELLKANALKQTGYQLAKAGAIGPLIDRVSGDVGSGGKLAGRPILMWLLDGYLQYQAEAALTQGKAVDLNFHYGMLTGKDIGGLEARGDATGLGIWFARKAYCEANNIPLKGESLFIRGVGAAERRAAIEAIKYGVKLQGIAATSARGGVVLRNEEGFKEQDIIELNQIYNKKGDMVAWAKEKQEQGINIEIIAESHESGKKQAEEISAGANDYFQKYAPLHIDDSAAQMTINGTNAKYIPTGAVVVQGGNGAVTPAASREFKKRGIHNVTGILANAAGVFASWFEQAQNLFEIQIPSDLVDQAIQELMYENVKISMSIMKEARKNNIDLSLEEAFYSYAIAQGYKQKMAIEQMN
ncbi:hypothetical protein M1328_05305 [Patescibacteria group bacterium]|nr:hypothetical protein [Patescibacteria group bacterium]